MKRQKRKYRMLIISSVVLTIAISVLYVSINKTFLYEDTEAVILSVDAKEREGGTSEDRYYYIESTLQCQYMVDSLEYRKTFKIKGDYSKQEGNTITLFYDKSNPYESTIASKSVISFLYSIAFTVGSALCIFFDIRNWYNIRKQENATGWQTELSYEDMLQYEKKKRRQKTTNILLSIICILLLPLALLELTLITYTIARNVDYRLCYKSCPNP